MRLIRLPEVLRLTALSRTTLYRKIKGGTFPRATRLGARSVAWVEEEVQAWIKSRMEERTTPNNI
ncbi:transcriptional regulator [Marinobacterium zhoushanense]|uniref:Transcriptional regulator n=1 Tax=Marinobacterium zhoushanense TaxID=1679163 RepID=A0ABQ1K3J6_9GAMM|nr:AlpA family transcriptional regulator [Marinobacterium zhoushanense]GGB82132.1 transcriptional regulator [Marinobacterium zhoushanense]